MESVLTVIGWMLVGGTAGYAVERWRFVYVIVLGLLGLFLIADPSPPGLIGSGQGGSWFETVGFVGGVLIGLWLARRERAA